MVSDKTNGTTNCMVAIGKVGKDGKLKVAKPIQLTDLPAGFGIFCTAAAINRADPSNIVVSYRLENSNFDPVERHLCRAVSFDGGASWQGPFDGINDIFTFNGPIASKAQST